MIPLISVILPIYKVEKYLKRAIDSVRGQTYQNLEIILVEDGSPDKCGEICEAYTLQDIRIKVVHKENGGLSDARNVGITVATGEYIAFVDSDDYIAPTFIEVLYKAIVRTGSDIALCRYVETTLDSIFEEVKETGETVEYSGRELSLQMYADISGEYTCFVVAWNKLYKRSLWKELRYPKGRIHEDEATTYKIYDKVKKGVFVKERLYAYYQMESSITRKPFSIQRLDCLVALRERIDFYVHKEDLELIVRTYKTLADTAIVDYRIVNGAFGTGAEEKQVKEQLKQYVVKTIKEVGRYGSLPIKTRIGYHIFIRSPRLYYILR